MLACLRDMHAALERGLATAAEVTVAELWRPELGRLALLELDLEDEVQRFGDFDTDHFALAQLGVRRYADRLLTLGEHNPIALVGPLFVLMASGVSRRVLADFKWAMPEEMSRSYFDACAEYDETLLARLEHLELGGLRLAAVQAAAEDTWRALADLCDALEPCLHRPNRSAAPVHVEREPSG